MKLSCLNKNILINSARVSLIGLLAISLLFSGCTSSGGDDSNDSSDSGSSDDNDDDNDDNAGVGEITLYCGAVKDNALLNPVSPTDGELVQINRIIDVNLLAVSDFSGQIPGSRLVQIQGISVNPSKREAALQYISSIVGVGAIMIEANGSCPITAPGGGAGVLGTVVLNTGQSISEGLVRANLADISSGDSCGGSVLTQCLEGIKGQDEQTAGELTSFLWKPTADSDGKLAVHTGPFGTTVIVNGETGLNRGPGNGFGSLARFSKQGCAYGRAQIQVLDAGGQPYTFHGNSTFTIIDPCQRNCISNGQMVLCPR